MPSKIDCVMNFGRFRGQLVSEVYESCPAYLKWVYENCDVPKDVEEAIKYHLE